MTLTYEQVTKRNRKHPGPMGGVTRALLLGRRGRKRVHYGEFHREVEKAATFGGGWKQPGRKYGPSPLGPDHPKVNKVTDSDGNPRIVPLSAVQRLARYVGTTGRRPVEPNPDAGEDELDARRHAALLGLTMRQRRRLVHKANRVSGYGDRVDRHTQRKLRWSGSRGA